MTLINPAKIYSVLGNPNSLIPLAVKDISATTGMTAGSFVTGKEEGVDRFIDEAGTEAIWLLGIPGFKLLFDKTVFKAIGLDSKFDARILKDKDIFEKTKKYAPTKEIRENIEKIGKNQKLFKNTAMAKFGVATALTVASYIGLTRFKQNYTEKKIRENLISEYNEKKLQEDKNNDISTSKEPSFKGLGKAIEYFAFSPVRNMWILDGCITAERLKDSRSPQEFIGYGIKEAMTLCFMYYAGGKIQEGLEKRAVTKHNKSIALDARVLEGNGLKQAFENGSVEKSLAEFGKANKSNAELYDFIHNNPDNLVVKVAKESDIIHMYKEPQGFLKRAKITDKIDTRKYIDLKEVEGVNKNISELYTQFKSALAKGEKPDEFFKSVRKLKRNSIKMNIGACILALGVITPALMLAKRFTGKDNQEFQTKKEVREKLIKEGLIEA